MALIAKILTKRVLKKLHDYWNSSKQSCLQDVLRLTESQCFPWLFIVSDTVYMKHMKAILPTGLQIKASIKKAGSLQRC